MAEGEAKRTKVGRVARGVSAVLGPLAALFCVIAFFAIAERARGGDTFLSVRNLQTVANQTAPLIVAALGMTVIIISGGIDLSAGSALALSACVMAKLLVDGHSVWLAIAACLGAGAVCGLINGVAVSVLRVVPFIVTLGTMTIYLGIAKIMAGDGSIRPEKSQFPAWREAFVYPVPPRPWLIGEWLPNFAVGVWLALALSVALALALRYTVFGRHVFALGSNEATARLCGVNVAATKIAVYLLGGLFIGMAGFYECLKLGAGTPTSATGRELEIIAAVVIGGASLSGGRGTVLGTIMGAAIMRVIRAGCPLLGIDNPAQDILIGLIIVGAVTVDGLRQRRLTSG